MKQAYITAVREQLLSGVDPEVTFSGLKTTLAKKGHSRLLGSILRGLLRELEHDVIASAPQITVAKEDAAVLAKAKTALDDLSSVTTLVPVIKIDDSLIGGYVVKTGERQVDASYKRALLEMYRQVAAR